VPPAPDSFTVCDFYFVEVGPSFPPLTASLSAPPAHSCALLLELGIFGPPSPPDFRVVTAAEYPDEPIVYVV